MHQPFRLGLLRKDPQKYIKVCWKTASAAKLFEERVQSEQDRCIVSGEKFDETASRKRLKADLHSIMDSEIDSRKWRLLQRRTT